MSIPPKGEEINHLKSVQRRDFLKMIGGATAMMSLQGAVNFWPQTASAKSVNASARTGRNVIIFMTDQERALQWFPPGWAEANLPCQTALAATGVTFTRAFTNTAMCTPARTTLFTGLYPAQHLSSNTLSEGNVQSESEYQLNPAIPNLGSVMTNAGYEVAYIGKYHLSKGVDQANGVTIWDDIERYRFTQWDPPDAGRNTSLADYGGGYADHDSRYISDALAYLKQKIKKTGDKPFCLVISLVNPHDVLGYPLNYQNGGYGADNDYAGVIDWLAPTVPPIDLPPTIDENLATNYKPYCQVDYRLQCAGLGLLDTDLKQHQYLNFYANLMKHVDGLFKQVVDLLESSPAGREIRKNSWIIRTADHGEYGLAHQGLRQKSFSVYEEAIRVPMIWSNPMDYPLGTGQQCEELVGHVDFLPTLCSILGIDRSQYDFRGTDYSSLIKNPSGPAVQDYVLFTYDDIWCGQNALNKPNGIVVAPNRIRAVRQKDFVYAYYFDGEGVANPNAEFYDLRTAKNGGTDTDPATGLPLEYTNLSAWADTLRIAHSEEPLSDPELLAKRTEVELQLMEAVSTKFQPLPTQPAVPPEAFKIGQVESTDVNGQKLVNLQITWLSRATTLYQLQSSADGVNWTNVNDTLIGNNGPIIVTLPLTDPALSYRLAWSPNTDTQQLPEPSELLSPI